MPNSKACKFLFLNLNSNQKIFSFVGGLDNKCDSGSRQGDSPGSRRRVAGRACNLEEKTEVQMLRSSVTRPRGESDKKAPNSSLPRFKF